MSASRSLPSCGLTRVRSLSGEEESSCDPFSRVLLLGLMSSRASFGDEIFAASLAAVVGGDRRGGVPGSDRFLR